MVARAGTGWRIAPCLTILEDQADALAPRRSKSADGSIASSWHTRQNPTSDHEPATIAGHSPPGYVTALDLTDDPPAFDARAIAEQLRKSRDRRLKYVIAFDDVDRQPEMYSSYPAHGFRPFTWRPYSGSNPHSSHMHISVLGEFIDDTAPWQIGDEVTEQDKKDIAKLTVKLFLEQKVGSYDPAVDRNTPKDQRDSAPKDVDEVLHRLHVLGFKLMDAIKAVSVGDGASVDAILDGLAERLSE